MDDDLLTVASFRFSPEAEAARLLLEAEGIPGFLADTETVNMDWLLGNAIGHIKLQVPRDYADAASVLLEQIQTLRSLEPEDLEESDDAVCLSCGQVLEEDETACPSCGWSYAGEPDVS